MADCEKCLRMVGRVQREIRLHIIEDYRPRESKIKCISPEGANFLRWLFEYNHPKYGAFKHTYGACCKARARYEAWNDWLNKVYLENGLTPYWETE